MCACGIVIAGIRRKHTPQMSLIEDDHVVEAFAAYRPDDPLGVTILPRRTKARRVIPNAHFADTTSKSMSKFRVIVRMRILAAVSKGKPSRSCCSSQRAVGCLATVSKAISRRA